jgi:hypothetical protein
VFLPLCAASACCAPQNKGEYCVKVTDSTFLSLMTLSAGAGLDVPHLLLGS